MKKVVVLVSVCCDKTLAKINPRGLLVSQVTVHIKGSQGRTIKSGTQRDREGMLPIVLFLLACSACFLIHQKTDGPGVATYSELDLPTSIINPENIPQTYSQANLIGTIPQLWYPLPQVTRVCVRLTKTWNQSNEWLTS